MSSLCNYSHPEMQITDGLIRHDTGQLFPYNPEFYNNATGLYGPGAIYCWYMLIASVMISWVSISDKDNPKKLGFSSDLLGVLAYPAFAATDLLIQSIQLLGVKNRALAIFCLRNPDADLGSLDFFIAGLFNTTQLNLNHIPPETLESGQRIIDITGPLAICYSATIFLPPLLILVFKNNAICNYKEYGTPVNWKPLSSVSWAVYTTYGYISLMLIIFQLSLGDILLSIFIFYHEAPMSCLMLTMYGVIGFISMLVLFGILCLISSLVAWDYTDIKQALTWLGWGIPVVGVFSSPAIVFVIINDKGSMIPDLGIKISERDQLATLIVGVVTLVSTLIELRRNLNEPENNVEGEGEVWKCCLPQMPNVIGSNTHCAI